MVYSGKPSRACDECRLRRTKCDTKKPSCSQCIRAGRTCKGYRDPGALIFRDEAQTLITRRQRAKDSEEQKKNEDTTDGRTLVSLSIPRTDAASQWALKKLCSPTIATLGTSADDQARCFFFTNYVTRPNAMALGTFDYLSEVYECQEIGSALSDSVAALGMVGLANFWKAPSINFNARTRYSSAMRMLSEELRSMEKAKSDQSLMATMLLGLYETNTCNSQQSIDTWTKHIKGATVLLQLRGKEQVKTSIGYHLFLHLRTQIVTNCAQQHYMIPAVLNELNQELDFEDTLHRAATNLSELSTRYCDLRTSMKIFHNYSEPERVITEACRLDAEFDHWAKTCPREYIYQTVMLKERHEDVFSDSYHMYSSLWVATVWNSYRCIRTLINEIIVDQLLHLQKATTESFVTWHNTSTLENLILSSNATLLQLCHEICASVPYFLNFQPDLKSGQFPEIPKAVHGNLLLWPLYCAGCTKMVSDVMRTWVACRLQWISDVMGIRQAAPLALTVLQRQDLSSWVGLVEEGVEISDKLVMMEQREQLAKEMKIPVSSCLKDVRQLVERDARWRDIALFRPSANDS